jgi:hypothetical protein
MDFGEMEANDVLVLERKFKIVHREIDFIKVKIHKKKGFLFFKSHVYTEQELLNSEHHNRIYAATVKIGDDATYWYKAGKLSDDGKNTYYNKKSQVETELHRVNLEIEQREPTWWENVRGAFEGFRRIVAANMPELVLTMIELVANSLALPIPLRKFFRLPYLDKKMIAFE